MNTLARAIIPVQCEPLLAGTIVRASSIDADLLTFIYVLGTLVSV